MAGDLSITALYTSQVWTWAGLSHANLFATPEAKRVFDVTNAALAFKRGVAPLRISLLHRHTMIDHLLRASRYTCVLELAAGLSRRGAAFAGELDYTEVDLPPVIARKRAMLERTAEGREVLAALKLVEADVTSVALGDLVAPPVFVIAEGLMMYLGGDARRALFARVRALGEHVRFVFDLTPSSEEPAPGLVGRALEAAMKRFTGGRSFERDARTREQVLDELGAAGWGAREAIASRDVAREWDLPHPEIATPTVLFSARDSG